jgi:hypothetical protein
MSYQRKTAQAGISRNAIAALQSTSITANFLSQGFAIAFKNEKFLSTKNVLCAKSLDPSRKTRF